MTGYPVELQQPGADPTMLRDELLDIIEQAIAAHPRTLQTRIGPSEIGTPCPRRLAHKLAGTPEQPRDPAWLPTVGTAIHTWLADVFTADVYDDRHNPDDQVFEPRWLVEHPVIAGDIGGVPFGGTVDLFDRSTGTVIDWKTQGKTSLDSLRRKGASPTYRTQAHVYGYGLSREGHRVERVMIVGLPRNELTVRKAVMWSEPYDPAVAVQAIARAHGFTVAAGVNPRGWDGLIPALPTADDRCGAYCPFWRAGHDNTDPTACGGAPLTKAATSNLAGANAFA